MNNALRAGIHSKPLLRWLGTQPGRGAAFRYRQQ
jgi:hypothetical protein